MVRLVALACAVAAAPAVAAAGPLDDYLGRIKKALDEAAAANTPRPPVQVPVRWGARRLGSFDLPAPLLAVEAADVDGDKTPELIGLTTAEVFVLEVSGGKLAIAARAPLPDKPALIRSRDPVGTLVVDGAGIAARSSEQAAGARYRWVDGKLVAGDEVAGFPLCAGASAELAEGRNYFDPKAVKIAGAPAQLFSRPFFSAECRDHVGVDGRPFSTAAVSDTGRVVRVACVAGACAEGAIASDEIDASGYAFEVADVDRDGRAEVIVARGQAPGGKDRVRVFAWRDGAGKQIFDHRFEGGVVALTAPDLDGDGAREVIAAVRMWRSKRINLWVLTRRR